MLKFRYNKLLENIVSLASIKGLQYVLAFITFPYLTRVLQVERFGAIVFAQSLIDYFIWITDYGFYLTAPKEVAKNWGKESIKDIFSSIFYAKLFLLVVCYLIFLFLIIGISKYQMVDFKLFNILFLSVVGNVIFPVWFFQGIQEMRYITLANIIAKIISVFGIFVFVKSPMDYLIAAFFQAIAPVAAAIVSIVIILTKYPAIITRPNCKSIKQQLKDGWGIFVSSIAMNIYTVSNTVFLGAMTNNVMVGYYSGAKKIISNITSLLSPISQAVYPHICQLADSSKDKSLIFLKNMIIIMGGSNFILSLLIFFFSEPIVNILLGNGYTPSVTMLRIMSFLPFIISLSNIFGIQTMLPFGMQNHFSRILLWAAFLNTIIVLPAIYFYSGIGVSCSILITELFVTITMGMFLYKKGFFDSFIH